MAPCCRPSYGALLVTLVATHCPQAWTLLRAVGLPWTQSGPPPPPPAPGPPSAGRLRAPGPPRVAGSGHLVPLGWQAQGADCCLEGWARGRVHACAHTRPPEHGSSSAAPATALSRSGQPSLFWKTRRDSGVSDSPQPSGRGDTLRHCPPLGASACGLASCLLWKPNSEPGALAQTPARRG